MRRDDNGQLPSSIELLRLYFVYMGKENRKFRGIPDATISATSWKGMSQIYEVVRKKANKLADEKQSSPQKSLAKPKATKSPNKTEITDKGEDKA